MRHSRLAKMMMLMGGLAPRADGIVSSGLVVEYAFDEGSGQVVTDLISGYNAQLGADANATDTDPTWGTGYLDFDGSNDYITAANVPDALFLGANGFTVCMVTNVNATPVNFVEFVSKNTGAGATNIPIEWRSVLSTAGYTIISPYIVRANATGSDAVKLHSPIDLNVYKMYSAVFPQAIESNVVYYENVCRFVASKSTGTQTGAATGANRALRMGAREDNGVRLDGQIAYCLIYNRQLSDAEIEQNYEAMITKMAERSITLPAKGVGLVFVGDSLTNGLGTTNGNDYPSQVLAALGTGYDKVNLGVPAEKIPVNGVDAQADQVLNITRTKNICVLWKGSNNIDDGTAATVVYGYITTYVTARKTAGYDDVIVLTVLPRTPYSAGEEEQRLALNTLIKNGAATGGYTVADVAGNTTIGDDTDAENTDYYADGTHMTAAGYAIVAGIVKTAIDAVMAT